MTLLIYIRFKIAGVGTCNPEFTNHEGRWGTCRRVAGFDRSCKHLRVYYLKVWLTKAKGLGGAAANLQNMDDDTCTKKANARVA